MTGFEPLVPEIFVLTMTCIVLMVDVFSKDSEHRLAYWLTQFTLVCALILVIRTRGQAPDVALGTFRLDLMGIVLKSFIYVTAFLVFIYARDYLTRHKQMSGEFFVLGLFAILGMMVLVSAQSLLTLYLGLELLSLSLYAMVAMNRDSKTASEAAMKYFVLGAIASGMLLYGMSILYGVTGSLDLSVIAQVSASGVDDPILLVFALVFVLVGVAFKLGLAPFHMWIPDVYEGAATPATLFIASAPKLAAFALAIRLLDDGLSALVADWQSMLVILALLSIAAGNTIAIAQTSIKRMLAYSTIAHMGYLALGIVAGSISGYAGAMFYAITYALMSAGAFGMIILLGRSGFQADQLKDFQGLGRASPWFAFTMLILMFSMAGVPPFVGFWAKWFVIKEVLAAGFVGAAAVAVVFSVVGAYYYLRVVKLMFFDEPEGNIQIGGGMQMRVALSVNGLALLALGLAPGLLMSLCLLAMRV